MKNFGNLPFLITVITVISKPKKLDKTQARWPGIRMRKSEKSDPCIYISFLRALGHVAKETQLKIQNIEKNDYSE